MGGKKGGGGEGGNFAIKRTVSFSVSPLRQTPAERANIPGPCPEAIWIPRRPTSNVVVIRGHQGERDSAYEWTLPLWCIPTLSPRSNHPLTRAPVNDREGTVEVFVLFGYFPTRRDATDILRISNETALAVGRTFKLAGDV